MVIYLRSLTEGDSVFRRIDVEVYARVYRQQRFTLCTGYIDYLAHNILPDLSDEDWLTLTREYQVLSTKRGNKKERICLMRGYTKCYIDAL